MSEKNYTKMLLMIKLLRKNGRIKLHELSKEIGVGERTIRRWKDMFTEMGYKFKSTGGRKGGYDLIEESLTQDEWLRIKEWNANIYNKLTKMLMDRV